MPLFSSSNKISDDFFAVGHGSVLEVYLNPEIKLNEMGVGNLTLKTSKPPALYFQNDAKQKMSSNSKVPLVEFGSKPNTVLIKKIDDKLYDFTFPNKKIVEVRFDNDCSQDMLQRFDDFLLSLGVAKKREIEVDPKNKTSGIANLIEKGGLVLSNGIDMASFWAGNGIRNSGKALKKRIEPLENPRNVNQKLKTAFSTAEAASTTVLEATTFVADTAEQTATFVVEKSITRSSGKCRNSSLKSAARASDRVLDSAYDAADNVISTTVETAAELIEHRYGSDAGTLSRQGSTVAKNSYKSYKNVNRVGRKSLMKAVARNQRKQMAI